MKNIKLHAIILALIVVAELIGTHTITIGIGRIVLLPMLFALLLGILTTPKFLNLSSQKEMVDASSLIGVTLMLHFGWSHSAEDFGRIPGFDFARVW